MVFNVLDTFREGLGVGRGLKADRLASALTGRLGNQGFDPSTSPEFQQLMALDPQRAAGLQQSFGDLSKERKTAFFQDSAKLLDQLNAGDSEGFARLIADRKNEINRLGGDPSDINLIEQRYMAGDIDGTRGLLDIAVNEGVRGGFIPDTRPKPKESKPFQAKEGGLVFDPNTATFTIDPLAKQHYMEMAELAKSKGGLGSKDRQSLNKDVTSIIKDTVNISKAASELDALKGRGSAAAKLGAVFKFMKSLDPTSVVRESEQGQVYAAQGAGAQLAGMVNSLLGEGQLTEAGFKDLVDTAKTIANSNISASSSEVGKLLDTFEDTIPREFKMRVQDRVPEMFNVEAAPAVQPGSNFTSSSGITFTVN